MIELKTSDKWYEEVPEEWKLIIIDADGWDRQNFEHSFYEEEITNEEFMKRVSNSTIQCSPKMFQ